jgi:ABC-2 type transport system ATP-binding protein
MHDHDTSVMARLRGADKRYGAVVALAGVDLALRGGEVHALLGANGAGKTTAIALLLGLLQADAGDVELFGTAPQSLHARRGAGIMLQSTLLQETLQVRELLDLTRSYYPDPRSVADCVALAGLDGLMQRRYGKLSGGQQRRVQFALAICGRPRVLFLDEPTTGLDIEARQGLWRAIRELVAQGSAVLLTTHYIEEAEALADRVTVLAHGRVVAAGAMHEVRARVSQRRIRCISTLDVDTVATWPQVRHAQRDGGCIDAIVETAEDVVRRLLAEDPGLRELEIQRAGLADAFLEITRDTNPEPQSALQEAA